MANFVNSWTPLNSNKAKNNNKSSIYLNSGPLNWQLVNGNWKIVKPQSSNNIKPS
jgi:hypothetical protein